MARAVFPLIILVSCLVHGEDKVFLVETETMRTVRDTIGEDYTNSQFGKEYVYQRECQKNCKGGLCSQKPNPYKDITMFLSKYIHTCNQRPTVVRITTPPPLTTTAPNADCQRMPRGRVTKKNKWGHRVRTGARDGRTFCCTKGPKTGELVRTPRCCKPKTPRRRSCP